MAALAEAWSTRFLPVPAVTIRAAMAMLLTVLGLPRRPGRDQGTMPPSQTKYVHVLVGRR
jgi:hypothetical protein